MTDPASSAGPAGTSWRLANIVLMVVALALLASSILIFTKGAAATPGDSRAEVLSRQYKEVTKAARGETLAFLTVDYKDMDPLIAKVLAGATGDFKDQYSRAKATLKSQARSQQAVSTGKVLEVGIADIDDKNAVVFVAADSQVTNKGTKGKAQPRNYRFKIDMVRKGDKWLASNLQFVA